MSNQRVVIAGLVGGLMFLVGGIVVLGATGWIHRPGAPVTSSSSPPEVARVAVTAPSVDPVVTTGPVIVATTGPVIVATTAATTTTTTPIATAVARSPVEGNAEIGAIVTSAPIANAERTIAGLRPGFRRCYNAGLASDPKMSGNVVIAIKVDPTGNVQHVDKVGGTGLSSAVESCIIDKAMKAVFAAPGGTGSTAQVPVTCAATEKGALDPFASGRHE